MLLQKIYIETHGCQMNEYDSSKMVDVLMASHALEKTENPEEADVLLLNTCSIREKAQEKVFSELGRWRLLKQKKPHLVIGVGGCVASQEGAAILERAPFVDMMRVLKDLSYGLRTTDFFDVCRSCCSVRKRWRWRPGVS